MIITLLVRVKGGPGSGNYGHAGRPGLVGGSGGGGGSALKNVLDAGMPYPAYEAIEEQLAGLPDKFFKDLNLITCEPPRDLGYRMGERAYLDKNGRHLNGVYNPKTRTIHIHPRAAENGTTAIHELGHHVTRCSAGWARDFGKLAKVAAEQHASSEIHLPDMGLRGYSLSNGHEYLADAFKVWRFGSDLQWANLNNYGRLALSDNHNLERLFGPRLELPR